MTDKPSRNEDEYFVRQDADILRKRRAEIDAESKQAERRAHFMKCPKDGYDLETRDMHGIAVEICSHCHGMWLDAGELESVSHRGDDHGLIGRVFGDVLASFKARRAPDKPVA
ncbi:MAG: zf-TFIIB domain-containing protein [Gemmatimonadales bacterium]|nr:zf-TFIIB domain-containing protein [Gemmatimonadales bacterium]